MSILFKVPNISVDEDPTEKTLQAKNLYIAKVYSANNGNDRTDLASKHYALVVGIGGKYYIVPTNNYNKAIEVEDIDEVKDSHGLMVQPSLENSFKSFSHYAPSAEVGVVTSDELRKLAQFIYLYFVKGEHAHRRDLDVYYRYLKGAALSNDDKKILLSLKNSANSKYVSDELSR